MKINIRKKKQIKKGKKNSKKKKKQINQSISLSP